LNPVYLDYNATAPIKPAVVAAMAEVLAGRQSVVGARLRAFGTARGRGAREQVAALVGAAPRR